MTQTATISRLMPLLGAAALCSALTAQALQSPPVPAGNPITPAKTVLGKILFWEEQMSSNNRVACGTCHKTELGGGDNRRAPHPGLDGVLGNQDDTIGSPGLPNSRADNTYAPDAAFGLGDQVTDRASPSFLTGAYFPEMFWDGRARGVFNNPETGAVSLPAVGALENQASAPPLSDVEMAHDFRNWNEIKNKLATAIPMALATNVPPDMAAAIAANRTYPLLFAAAFGDPAITAERIAFAIASYERSLVPDQTPWDQAQRGVPGAMTQSQINGMNTFLRPPGPQGGPGGPLGFGCGACHVPPLFAGVSAPPGGGAPVLFRNLGLRPIAQDNGRQGVTGNAADAGRFKVPSIRNSGLRNQFMHTGQFQNLGQVLGFYIGGGGPNGLNKDPLLVPLNPPPPAPPIPQQVINEVIDFVSNALTDPRVRNRQFPFDRPTLLSERVPPIGIQFGASTPGSGLQVPSVLAGVPANIGNVDFKVGIGNALGGSPALLVVSTTASAPGTTFAGFALNIGLPELAQLPIALEGPAGQVGRGFGTVLFPIPFDTGLSGLTMFVQWFVADPNGISGVAASRGAEIRFF
jgi:cytochrome c peroxidase